MSIKFLTNIVDIQDKAFSTTTLYDMVEAIQPLNAIWPNQVQLVSKNEPNPEILANTQVVVLQEGCLRIPSLGNTENAVVYVIAPNSVKIIDIPLRNEGKITIIYFYGTAAEWEAVSKFDTKYYECNVTPGFPLVIEYINSTTNGEEEE